MNRRNDLLTDTIIDRNEFDNSVNFCNVWIKFVRLASFDDYSWTNGNSPFITSYRWQGISIIMMEDGRLRMIETITVNGFQSSQGSKEAVISSIDHLLASIIQFDG